MVAGTMGIGESGNMTVDKWKKLMAKRDENVMRTENFSLVTWVMYEPRKPDWTIEEEVQKWRRDNER